MVMPAWLKSCRMSTDDSLTHLSEFRALAAHYKEVAPVHMRDLFAQNPKRFDDFHLSTDGMLFDYSKNHLNDKTIGLLCDLARARGVEALRDQMMSGARVNTTQDRRVLHTALRAPCGIDDVDAHVLGSLEKVRALSDALRNDPAITDVIHIGIGGSDLAPRAVYHALSSMIDGPAVHYISNIDADEIKGILAPIDPKKIAIIVVSKSFGTLETIENAKLVKAWAPDAPVIAVSENSEAARAFGVSDDHILPMKDWMGGRYSVWSAAGFSLAVAFGHERFLEFLSGAAAADEHFKTQPLERNIPALMAMISVWCHNFYKYPAHAILPYPDGLRYFPAYLQQLDMESNGKSVSREGKNIDYKTGPLIFGGIGTNAQHAFLQHFHQSHTITPIDFILCATTHAEPPHHHTMLNANALGQAQALMQGRDTMDEPHQNFPGNRPSSTFILDELSPFTLGQLMAFYEHKVFVQGAILGINCFDQWGVALGKTLAKDLISEFSAPSTNIEIDSSTAGLMTYIQERSA